MSRHVCEVWAEQGRCPHTHPNIEARLENMMAGISVMKFTAPKIVLPDGRTLDDLAPFKGKS